MKNTWREFFLGRAKDPLNPRVFHTITLAAFLAWVGLGADGLSSSCYGPEEGFLALFHGERGSHAYLALPLAAFTAFTVFVISASYSQLIELFPTGGGGYLVTTKLLGKGPGVVCGCALVIDYILTIAVSIAAGVEAVFSPLVSQFPGAIDPATNELEWKLRTFVSIGFLIMLILLNLRGVKESIRILLPIFLIFLATHLIGILTAILGHTTGLPELFASLPAKAAQGAREAGGWLPLLGVLFYAYSLGGGTYTGIEAVSNSTQILREPRVETGKRTMLYMAISLAFTASGLLVGYLLLSVDKEGGKTLNAVFFERAFGGFAPGGVPVGHTLVVITLFSEGALLFVAAQAGFIGGPRTLATMALDRWVPTRFAHLSNRLVIQDGVLFMGGGALLFLLFTKANPKILVILYSINVFLTFTLSQLGMCIHWLKTRITPEWRKKLSINGIGLILTTGILVMMLYFKFALGGWVTLVITGVAVMISFLVRGHYESVRRSIRELDMLIDVSSPHPPPQPPVRVAGGPTAVLLVGGFNGLGIHSFLTVLRLFPNHFRNYVFVSVGVIDFEEFKGKEEIENLRRRTLDALGKYAQRAESMGLYAENRFAIGTDLVDEVERMAADLVKEFPGAIFFGGQLVFENENLFTRSLHSQAAFEIQRRLQLSGLAMVLLPVRVRDVKLARLSGWA